jgi:hypothetical protein
MRRERERLATDHLSIRDAYGQRGGAIMRDTLTRRRHHPYSLGTGRHAYGWLLSGVEQCAESRSKSEPHRGPPPQLIAPPTRAGARPMLVNWGHAATRR